MASSPTLSLLKQRFGEKISVVGKTPTQARLEARFGAKVQPQDQSAFQHFTGRLASGIDTLQATAGGGVALGGRLIGSKSLQEFGMETYLRNLGEASLNRVQVNTFDQALESPSNFIKYVAGGLGAITPSVAESALVAALAAGAAAPETGPGAAVIGPLAGTVFKGQAKRLLAKALARGISKEAAEKSIAKLGRQRLASTLAVFGSSSLHEGGAIYGDLRERGIDAPGTALAGGLISGASEAVVPAILTGKTLGALAKMGTPTQRGILPSLSRAARATAETGAEEAFTEFFQEGVSTGAKMKADPSFRPSLGEFLRQGREVAILGALSGPLGGAVSITNDVISGPPIPDDAISLERALDGEQGTAVAPDGTILSKRQVDQLRTRSLAAANRSQAFSQGEDPEVDDSMTSENQETSGLKSTKSIFEAYHGNKAPKTADDTSEPVKTPEVRPSMASSTRKKKVKKGDVFLAEDGWGWWVPLPHLIQQVMDGKKPAEAVDEHRAMVEKAIADGRRPPDEVLADYPDLVAQVPDVTHQTDITDGKRPGENQDAATSGPDWDRMGFLPKLVSVTWAFKRAGMPLTGEAFRRMPSFQEGKYDEGKKLANDIWQDLGKDQLLWKVLPLYFEDKQGFQDWWLREGKEPLTEQQLELLDQTSARLQTALDQALKDLEAVGVLDQGFMERLQHETQNSLDAARVEKDFAEVKRLEGKLKDIEGKRWIHIAYKDWFEDGLEGTKDGGKVLAFMNKKKRKVFLLRDLLEGEALSLDDVNIGVILNSYFTRLGNDLAIGEVLKAAVKEGAAVKTTPQQIRDMMGRVDSQYVPVPGRVANAFSGHLLHRELADWLEVYTKPTRHGNIAKFIEAAVRFRKMNTFTNPLVMPTYDLIQSFLVGGLTATGWMSGKNFRLMREAIRDVAERRPAFYLNSNLAGFSKPYGPLQEQRQRDIDEMYLRAGAPRKREESVPWMIARMLGPAQVKALYNISWNWAWAMDQVIRQATFRSMLEKGMTPEEAAQVTAVGHGDYADVPARTRKALNFLTYTPTFTIAMTRLAVRMAHAAITNPRLLIPFSKPTNVTEQLAHRAWAVGGLMMGLDILFTGMLGFERDQFGRRYRRRVFTEDGFKDVNVTLPMPLTPIREYWRVVDAFTPGEGTVLSRWLRSQRGKMTPLLTDINQLLTNKDSHFHPIYDPGDPPLKRMLDQGVFMLKASAPLIFVPGRAFPEATLLNIGPEEQIQAQAALRGEAGELTALLLNRVAFTYMTQPKEKRIADRMRTIYRRMRETDPNDPFYKSRMQKQIDDLQYLEELLETL